MGKYQIIPDEHHVARRCSSQRLDIDEQGNIIGVSPAFFKLRPEKDEKYLSCNWLEYFEGTKAERLQGVKISMKKIKGGKSSRVILSQVQVIKSIGNTFGARLIAKTKGGAQDPSYSGIYGMPLDNSNDDLLAALADGAVAEMLDLGPWPK